MGLISWIKCKYYNHKLDSADNQLSNGNIEKAEEIYLSLLGNQDEAVVHLSNLYVTNSTSKDLKLDRLHKIEELNEFVNENNSSDYQKELQSHVSNIYNMAQQLFSSKDYEGAVSLYESIKKYKGNESEYQDRYHRYKAFRALGKSQGSSTYNSYLNECIEELKLISRSKESDIRNIQQILSSQKRFTRAIYLLLPFKSLNGDFKNSIIDYIIQVLSNNDSEIKNPKHISDFCNDSEISSLAAREVAARAVSLASKSRYSESVVFDNFASEYLSNDNKFNNNRCQHALEELSTRADHQEVAKLLQLAHQLKLTDNQISALKQRILQIATSSENSKGIKICHLFKGEKQFDENYFKIATKIAEEGHSNILDINELRTVISNISSEDNVTDYLAPFVGYVGSLKNEFFTIVNNIYQKGDIDTAYAICDKIKKFQNIWIALYIQLREKDLLSVKGITHTVKFYQDSTDKILQVCSEPNTISEIAYSNLWENYAQVVIKKSSSQPKDKAIDSLIDFRERVHTCCKSTQAYNNIIDSLTNQIVKILWSYAVELEEEYQYDKAIELYDKIKIEDVKSYTTRANFRSLIASVKAEKLTAELDKQIKVMLNTRSFESLREDLAYRYALLLLKTTHPSEAENILKKYLPDETALLSVCNNIFVKEAEDKLHELNAKFAAMNKGELSADEAIALHSTFDSRIALITSRLTDTKSELPSYKTKIEGYILRRLYNEELYSEAFDKMRLLYPNFIENDNAFRNIAIASLGLLEKGETDSNKIKMAISVWLSAIYTDKLFVKSLDYTSWDDPYTFTLQNSLGNTQEYEYDQLPDNVNYNDPIENQVVSIKDVQNSLLSRVEVIIRDKYPSYEDFYNTEKSAIEGIIKLSLDEDFVIASPFLAQQSDSVFNSIANSLEYDYQQNYENNEDVLNIGVVYGLTKDAFGDFKTAKQIADNCCSSLKSSAQAKKSAFANISRIKNYHKLYASVKSAVSTAMNEAIRNKINYSTFIDQYEVVCQALNEVAISLSCANYVNGEVIHLLNDNSMKERDGIGYLARIYRLAPSNIQVKNNLEGVFRSLVRIVVQSNQRADINALNNALSIAGPSFKKVVDMTMVVQKVNADKMSKKDALSTIYSLYCSNKADNDVCENLATLCDLCIWEYIVNDSYEEYTVRTQLDRILNNRSSKFISHSDCFAASFMKIMQELSDENRMTILLGINLNSHGQALRRGLSYFAKFAPNGTLPDKIANIFK